VQRDKEAAHVIDGSGEAVLDLRNRRAVECIEP
jgi:hypothetical protein